MSRTNSVKRAGLSQAARYARPARPAVTVVLILGLLLSGCGVGSIGKVINAVHAIADAARSLRSLQSEIQNGEKASYQATYKTTGGSGPSTVITFAQEPGGKYAFTEPGTGASSATELVGNGKTQYECTQSGSGAQWACFQSTEVAGSPGSAVAPFVDFTGAFVYELAEALQVEAAVQGFKVTSSAINLNGIPLKCVSLTGKVSGKVGVYEWCVTAGGVLGMAKYTGGTAGAGSSFEITKLDTNPPASVFEPPAGANFTQLTTPTT